MSQFTAVSTTSAQDELVQQLVEVTELPELTVKRFVEKFEVQESGCWKWTGYHNDPQFGYHPYGRFFFQKKLWVSHKWIWEQVYGPVPTGLVLDHFLVPDGLCIGPMCANPNHVRPTTFADNVRRGTSPTAKNSRKTHCVNGHPYDGVNHKGARICKSCEREYKRKWNKQNRALKAGAK